MSTDKHFGYAKTVTIDTTAAEHVAARQKANAAKRAGTYLERVLARPESHTARTIKQLETALKYVQHEIQVEAAGGSDLYFLIGHYKGHRVYIECGWSKLQVSIDGVPSNVTALKAL